MTQFKKEVTTLRVNKLALAVALGLSLGLAGCGDDQSVSNAVGVPNPNALMPTGTIQGTLVDAVTNEPIVGAVVDIGIASATTSATGQFVIQNVPATTTALAPAAGAAGAGAGGAYDVTIDLRQVKAAASGAKYPDFSYSRAPVSYTTLADGTGASSNHATPVTGLVAPISLTVGKLAAGIKGVVAKTSTFKAAGAGYTVKLVSIDGCGDNGTAGSTAGVDACNTLLTGANTNGSATSGKGGTGANEHVVAMVTTKEDGAFSFEKIESLQLFRIDVVNADGTERGSELVKSPADDQVKALLIQRAGALSVADGALLPADDVADLRTVFVSTTDTLAPTLLSVSPENGFDVPAETGSVDVKFTFSEPIKATPYAKALTAASISGIVVGGVAVGGLYNDVVVNFLGAKTGNIPHKLAWNAAMTELTVTIPNAAKSSRYSVSIVNAGDGTTNKLVDVNNVPFVAPTTYATVNFSTNGAVTPAAVTTVTVTNRATLNAGVTPSVDWLPVASAKSYNVYRATSVSGSPFSDFQRIANTTSSDLQDNGVNGGGVTFVTTPAYAAPTFVVLDGDLKVAYKYKVRPVSYDNTELAASTDVADATENAVAQDRVSPTVMAGNFTGVAAGSTTVTVRFAEQMDEASAETVGNYNLTATTGTNAPTNAPTIAAPTPSLAVYDRSNDTVTLTFASGIPAGTTLTVTGVKDVAGNVMTAIPVGSPAGTAATNTENVPKVTTNRATFATPVAGGTTMTTTVEFSADMDATDALNVAKYTLAAPATNPVVANATVASAAFVVNGGVTDKSQVVLTLSKALNPSTTLTVTAVKGEFGTVADNLTAAPLN